MEHFYTLQKLVQSGALQITWIDSIARSNSTALEIALTESPDYQGQINEPYRQTHNMLRKTGDTSDALNETARFILEQGFTRWGLEHASETTPVRIVIKDMADAIPEEDWQHIRPLIKNSITLIRDPLKQIGSLVELSENYQAAHKRMGGLMGAWRTLYNRASEMAREDNWHLIDSDHLLEDPEHILTTMCHALGITYSPNMVHNWTKATHDNFVQRKQDVWSDKAVGSSGFLRKQRTPTSIDQVPVALQEQVCEILSIYNAFGVLYNARNGLDHRLVHHAATATSDITTTPNQPSLSTAT